MRDGVYALQSRNSSLQSADASHYRSSGALTHQQLQTTTTLQGLHYPACSQGKRCQCTARERIWLEHMAPTERGCQSLNGLRSRLVRLLHIINENVAPT